jgi:hypothetical protein
MHIHTREQEEYTRCTSTCEQADEERMRMQHAKMLAEERAATLATQFERAEAELEATRRLQHQTREDMRNVEIKHAKQVRVCWLRRACRACVG